MSITGYDTRSELGAATPLDAHLPMQERLPLLLATLTVPVLSDDVLMSLFAMYQVVLFKQASELVDAGAVPVTLVLLSASAGAELTTEAHLIRTRWPLARIILLGEVPRDFDDNLYDHAVSGKCTFALLTAAFHARSIDLWSHNARQHGMSFDVARTPVESDPSKAQSTLVEEALPGRARDLPAKEQQVLLGVSRRTSQSARSFGGLVTSQPR